MSTQNMQMADASITELDDVGAKRASQCSVETVGELATEKAQAVYNDLASTGLGKQQVEAIVNEAREMVGIDQEAIVYTEGPSDEFEENRGLEIPDNAMSTTESADESEPNSTTDHDEVDVDGPDMVGVDEFLEDDIQEPTGVGNVLLIAGEGAFDETGGRYGDYSPKRQAGLIHQRFEEFNVPLEEIEELACMRRGAGRVAVKSFLQHTPREELPDEFGAFDPNFDEFEQAGDAYEDCRARSLEWADTVVVFANGDYVGMWVMEALEHNVRIETPEQDEDEDDE